MKTNARVWSSKNKNETREQNKPKKSCMILWEGNQGSRGYLNPWRRFGLEPATHHTLHTHFGAATVLASLSVE